MAAMVFIFILALALFLLDLRQGSADITRVKEARAARSNLLVVLKDELSKAGVKVQIDEKHGLMRIEEGILFDSGEPRLKLKGKRVLNKLGPIFYNVLTYNDGYYLKTISSIFIEGHTDRQPFHYRAWGHGFAEITEERPIFKDNWDLSTQRAINTLRYLIDAKPERCPNCKELTSLRNESLFGTSGYAHTRPVDESNKALRVPENRRIEFRFAIATYGESLPIVKQFKQELMK